MSYAKSANAAFARMADEMGGETFVASRSAWASATPRSTAASPWKSLTIPRWRTTWRIYMITTCCGPQRYWSGELAVTPLQMSMVVLPVLNGGDLPALFCGADRQPYRL